MGRDTRETANELRAIAPLVVLGPTLELVGPCTIVTNGNQTIAFSSAEVLHRAREPLAIALNLDGSRTLRVSSWTMGRVPHMGVITLAEAFPVHEALDVTPIAVNSLRATVDTRGAPSALVTVEQTPRGLARRVVPVHVDDLDARGMSDLVMRIVSPVDARDVDVPIDGAALIAWMPHDPVLGRASEVLAVALASAFKQRTHKPRELAAFAELFGLDDLGRALPWEATPITSSELAQVAGEIRDASSDPVK